MGEATGYYEQREEELGAEHDARGRAPGDAAASSTSTGASTSTRWTTSQEGIHLRAMGQKDPLVEWQREGFEMFGAMMQSIAQDFVQVRHARPGRRSRSSRQTEVTDMALLRRPADPSEGGGHDGRPPPAPRRSPRAAPPTARPPPPRSRTRSTPGREVRLGQDAPQRAVPLRQRQEVQALPRRGVECFVPEPEVPAPRVAPPAFGLRLVMEAASRPRPLREPTKQVGSAPEDEGARGAFPSCSPSSRASPVGRARRLS